MVSVLIMNSRKYGHNQIYLNTYNTICFPVFLVGNSNICITLMPFYFLLTSTKPKNASNEIALAHTFKTVFYLQYIENPSLRQFLKLGVQITTVFVEQHQLHRVW